MPEIAGRQVDWDGESGLVLGVVLEELLSRLHTNRRAATAKKNLKYVYDSGVDKITFFSQSPTTTRSNRQRVSRPKRKIKIKIKKNQIY